MGDEPQRLEPVNHLHTSSKKPTIAKKISSTLFLKVRNEPLHFLNCKTMVVMPTYGWFLKWWYLQIIHFNRVFQYKPSILGYPYFWKHPYRYVSTVALRVFRYVCQPATHGFDDLSGTLMPGANRTLTAW